MTADSRDSADDHLDRWDTMWTDPGGRDRETEGALYRMVRVRGASLRSLRELLSSSPVTYDEFMTLHQLNNGQNTGPFRSTPAELAQRAGVSRAAMTGRVTKLARKGYVTRSEDDEDRRRQVVEMSEAGRSVWWKVLQAWSAAEREQLSALTVDELKQLNELLRQVVRSLD